ncbi:FKBP12-associated protein, partial [Coemansia sp. RSA 2703]
CDHPCPAPCHAGECPPCAAAVRKPCRCGAETAASAVCGQPALCDRVCALKRLCRRHRCNATCCPGDAAHHACPLTCNRLLACKQHRCTATCHAGPCAPCQTTSSVALVCGCGRTRVEAPVACGASLPACRFACERVRACGHYSVAAHECHAADTACPPCAVLVTTPCMCGARELRSIPCYRAGGASCGRICGRLLACGGHTCQRSCHRPDDMCLAPGASCQQRCGKPRKACGHACILPCHSPAMCSEALPCAAKVDVACACGRLTAQRTCDATSVAPSTGAAPLECDELCRVAERNRRVALALGLSERADAPLDGLARMRYSDAVLQFARAHSAWVRDIEAQLAAFVGDRARAALNFPPMRPRQRAFLHALAPAYGCSSRSVDREPVRSVCWARTPHTTLPSIAPSAAARYARPPAVVCSDRVLAAEEADFDDAASHIFEPAQPPVPAPASASASASAADRQRRKIDFLAISDLRHGLT